MSRKFNILARPAVFLFIFLSVFLGVVSAQVPARPNPPKLVNDIADALTPEQERHLEERLVAYDDSTSVQIAVVIVNDLGGANIDDYAIELGRTWGVGNKKTNNGVVVLLSVGGGSGQRGVFIAPGYGLEASLPDYTCKTIVDAEMIPRFREGNLYRGIEEGTDAIIAATRGQYTAPDNYSNRGKKEGGPLVFVFIVIFVIIILFIGRRGGGGGDSMTRRGHRHGNQFPPFFFFPPIGGGGGSGGGWSGGGGGGFGGFGGGSFGGGGAGGSW